MKNKCFYCGSELQFVSVQRVSYVGIYKRAEYTMEYTCPTCNNKYTVITNKTPQSMIEKLKL